LRDKRIERQQRRFDRASAVVAMAQSILRGERLQRTPVDVVVAVSAETLHEPDSRGVGVLTDGTCVSTHAARRLACDAGIIRVVEADDGTLLSVGRKTRSIPSSIKRALARRDHDMCRYPGCTHRAFLEGHHIEHWAHGGETALTNLVLLCSHHHRYLHEYGHQVEISATGVPTFRDRSGEVVPDHPAPTPTPDAFRGMPTIRAENHRRNVTITSRTNAVRSDGHPMDLGLAVHSLLQLDHVS
jgi:hypothetical protein